MSNLVQKQGYKIKEFCYVISIIIISHEMERELRKLEKELEEEIYNNDNDEKKMVDDLRAIVERQDPSCKVI